MSVFFPAGAGVTWPPLAGGAATVLGRSPTKPQGSLSRMCRSAPACLNAPGGAAADAAGPGAEAHGAGAAGWPLWAGAGRGVLEAAQEVAHRLRSFRGESDGAEGAAPGLGSGGPGSRPADAGGVVTPHPPDADAADPDPDPCPNPNPATLDQLDLDRAFAELDAVLGGSSRQAAESAVSATPEPGPHHVSGLGEGSSRSRAANHNAGAADPEPSDAAQPAPDSAPGPASGPQSKEQASAAALAEGGVESLDDISGPTTSAGAEEAGPGAAVGRAPGGEQGSGSAAGSSLAAPAQEAEEAGQPDLAAREPEAESGMRACAALEPEPDAWEPDMDAQEPDLAAAEPGFPASAASDGSFMSAASGSLASALSEGFAGGAPNPASVPASNPEQFVAALRGAGASDGAGGRVAQPTGGAAQPADWAAQTWGDAGGAAGAIKSAGSAPDAGAEPGAAAVAAAPANGRFAHGSAPGRAAQQYSGSPTLRAPAGTRGGAPQAALAASASAVAGTGRPDIKEDHAAAGGDYEQNGVLRSAADARREQGSASPFAGIGSRLHNEDASAGPAPGPRSEPGSRLGSGSGELPVSHHAAAPALSLASAHDLPVHPGDAVGSSHSHAAAGMPGDAAPAQRGESLWEGGADAPSPQPSGVGFAGLRAGGHGAGVAGAARLPGGTPKAPHSAPNAGGSAAGADAVPDLGFSGAEAGSVTGPAPELGFSGAAAGSAVGSALGSAAASERADSEAQGPAPSVGGGAAGGGGGSDAGDSFGMVAPSDAASLRADSDGARLVMGIGAACEPK